MDKKEKEEVKEMREGVKKAEEQVGFQKDLPNVIDANKSDGQRLYEVYLKANNYEEDNDWSEFDESEEWEAFAKQLLETGGRF